MDYKKYFVSLGRDHQDSYALEAGTTGTYLRTHIFVSKKRRKIPRPDLIECLAKASKGKVTLDDVLEFLYKTDVEKKAA